MDTISIVDIAIRAIGSTGTIIALLTLTYNFVKDRRIKKEKQAVQIATWLNNYSESVFDVVISNNSSLPIYDVVVSRDMVLGEKTTIGKTDEECVYIQIVPPGRYKFNLIDDTGGMCKQFNSSISFRDNQGLYWCRDARGMLFQIKNVSSVDQRNLVRPVNSSVELSEC